MSAASSSQAAATFVLASADGKYRLTLTGANTVIIGRDSISDFPLNDPAVSRRHAEIQLSDSSESVRFTDLDSRNGTWLNGKRMKTGNAVAGDILQCGGVSLVLSRTKQDAEKAPTQHRNEAGLTMVRERPIPSPDKILSEFVIAVPDQLKATQRLTQLVGIAQRLGAYTHVNELLDAIARDLLTAFDADRVAVLLTANDGSLTTSVSRDKLGAIPRPVSRVISEGVASRQVALLTNNASQDVLTAGESVVQQSVKSALAAPLLSTERATIGVLYADHLRSNNAFKDDDLAFLVAIAGIASAAVERETAAERIRVAERARENLGRYFTPQLADRIASSPTPIQLGGARQPVVVLFSDIRSFTEIAESLAPTAMATQLNEYFEAMVACLFKHDGALDKFIGDAVMAYWGAPESSERDAANAVAAAVEMQQTLARLNESWLAEGRPQLKAGIGIHAGDAFVGNIGSPKRLEFTLIGDTVNVANRLCALAGGGEILISELAANRAKREDASIACRLRSGVHVHRHTGPDSPVWEVVISDSPPVGQSATF